MLKTVKTTFMAALVGLAALAAVPAAAQSGGSIYLGFGSGHPSVGIQFDDRGHYHRRDHDRRHFRRAGACSPREAVRKARRMGLRQAHVVSADRRGVHVRGRTHGYRMAVMTFANRRNCPLVR
jgi:hypothetical protein